MLIIRVYYLYDAGIKRSVNFDLARWKLSKKKMKKNKTQNFYSKIGKLTLYI